MSIKETIRNEKRYERSLLSDAHLARLSDNFLTQWMKFSKELSYQSIAIYYPFDNEASPLEIFNYLHSKNKEVLLPVIENNSKTLLFAKYDIQSKLVKNNFGIAEPKDKEFVDIEAIDIALIPCVAFNDKLFRLGLFVLGCSPGGNGSNFWTLLLNGDINLSITMTFVSTVAALGMMPLWIFA